MIKKIIFLCIIFASCSVIYLTQYTKKEKKMAKDWSLYISASVNNQTDPLFQKVMKKYMPSITYKNDKQYRAVNFGSGAGIEDINLINQGWEVLSIDITPLSGKVIAEKTQDSEGKSIFFNGDFSEVRLIGKYDLAMSFFSLPFGAKEDLSSLLRKVSNHLEKNGILVMNFFGEDHEFVKKNRAYGISQKEILNLMLDCNLKILEFENKIYQAPAFSSPKGQQINWEVLEVIAVKT